MELSRERPIERSGLLYPLLVIAAIAVIVFSVLGIASMTGWMPNGLMSRASATDVRSSEVDTARSGATFECAECGVIESMREIDRSGAEDRSRGERLAMLEPER